MKRKTQDRTNLRDWVIYRAKTPNGWSIVIMPENIRIDNYHTDKAHIHPNPLVHEHKIELGIENPDEIEDIIKNYLHFCKAFNVNELMEMLK